MHTEIGVEAWLTSVDLGGYSSAVMLHGYGSMRALLVAKEQHVIKMTKDPKVQMKPPHRELFVAEWKKLTARA